MAEYACLGIFSRTAAHSVVILQFMKIKVRVRCGNYILGHILQINEVGPHSLSILLSRSVRAQNVHVRCEKEDT